MLNELACWEFTGTFFPHEPCWTRSRRFPERFLDRKARDSGPSSSQLWVFFSTILLWRSSFCQPFEFIPFPRPQMIGQPIRSSLDCFSMVWQRPGSLGIRMYPHVSSGDACAVGQSWPLACKALITKPKVRGHRRVGRAWKMRTDGGFKMFHAFCCCCCCFSSYPLGWPNASRLHINGSRWAITYSIPPGLRTLEVKCQLKCHEMLGPRHGR